MICYYSPSTRTYPMESIGNVNTINILRYFSPEKLKFNVIGTVINHVLKDAARPEVCTK